MSHGFQEQSLQQRESFQSPQKRLRSHSRASRALRWQGSHERLRSAELWCGCGLRLAAVPAFGDFLGCLWLLVLGPGSHTWHPGENTRIRSYGHPGENTRDRCCVMGLQINPAYFLEGLMLKLQYCGHLMLRADSLEKTLMLGKIEGRRRRA